MKDINRSSRIGTLLRIKNVDGLNRLYGSELPEVCISKRPLVLFRRAFARDKNAGRFESRVAAD